MIALLPRLVSPSAILGPLIVSTTRFFPEEIDAVQFIPFCALVGGFASASWHLMLRGFKDWEGFPLQESFRGAFLGALFGLAFIMFGLVDG